MPTDSATRMTKRIALPPINMEPERGVPLTGEWSSSNPLPGSMLALRGTPERQVPCETGGRVNLVSQTAAK